MEILIALFFAFLLITLIGHGIWVLLATIYRAISGEPESQSVADNDPGAAWTRRDAESRRDAECAECGAALRTSDSFCSFCGRSRAGIGPVANLATTARQLDIFLNTGKLDAETHKVVMRVVEEERARLIARVRPSVIETRRETEAKPVRLAEPAPIPMDQPPEVSPRTAPAVIEQNIPVVEPRRSFAEMLEAFMEESSIKWGELIGGLLIIGCSIALVVSLWSEIADKPFIQFSVFIGVTTALFGLGFYSAHRWKLPTTSRGVLIISTLLAPLDFLAMAAFSREVVPPSLPVVGGELFSLALFVFLVYQAAKVFAPRAPWMTALATMGPSFAMLMARHSSWAQDGWGRAALLGVAPLLCYIVSCGVILRGQAKETESDELEADQIFTNLGIASFAALLPLGLFFINPGYVSQTLRQFAPLVSLFGIPAIVTGVVSLQVADERQSGKTQTICASVAIIGSLISLAALIFAWPNAIAVVITAAINCAVCLTIALGSYERKLRYDLRLAHAGAIAHLSLVILIVSNLISGGVLSGSEDGPRLAGSFSSKTSAAALAFLFTAFAIVSEWSLKKERKLESRIYGIGSLAAGALGLSLITWHGFRVVGDPHHAALGYAFYALAAFVIAWRREEIVASWVGSVLLFLTVVQSLAYKFGQALAPYHPVRLSTIVFANVAIVASVVATIKSERARTLFAGTFNLSALIASMAVAPFLIFEGWMTTTQISTRILWLAVIWLVIACLRSSPILFAAFQIGLATSLTFWIAHTFGHQWPQSFIGDLTTMQAQAVGLALLSLVWIVLRLALRRFGVTASIAESQYAEGEVVSLSLNQGVAAKLLYPDWPRVDRVMTALSLVFLAGLSLYGVHVGMIEGLYPGQALTNESRNLGATALGSGSWLLLLALSLVFIAGLWEEFEKRAALALLILLACACLLIAGRWQDDGLTPTIYRWSSAVAFAAVSSLILFRTRLTQSLRRFEWPHFDERSSGLARSLRYSSLALFAAPVLVFTLMSFLTWGWGQYASHSSATQAGAIALLIGPILLIALSFISLSARERSAGFACAAGLLVNLSVTLGYLMILLWKAWPELTDVYAILQLNIIATSICSLVWIGFHRRQSALDTAWPRSESFLKTQAGIALFSALSLLAVADARLFFDPWTNSALADSFGGVIGITAVGLSIIAYARVQGIEPERLRARQFGVVLLVLGSLLVCIVSRFAGDEWVAYRALMLTLNAAAWLMLLIRRIALTAARSQPSESAEPHDPRSRLFSVVANIGNQRSVESWVSTLAWATGAMILRGVSLPGEPWWTAGFSISLCLLFTGLSLVGRRRGYIYLAAAAINYATSIVYLWTDPDSLDLITGFFDLNAIALALPAIVWLAIHLRQIRAGVSPGRIAPFHRVAARISIGLLIVILLSHWVVVVDGSIGSAGFPWMNWLAIASVVALLVACLWDRDFRFALRGLYGAGLIAAGMTLFSFESRNEAGLVLLVGILSFYTLATSLLWRSRESLARIGSQLGMPLSNEDSSRIFSWLITFNVLLGYAAYVLTFFIVFSFESLSKRLITSTLSIAIPISMALMINAFRSQRLITNQGGESQAEEEKIGDSAVAVASRGFWGSGLVMNCVWMALLSASLWGWSWLSPVEGLQVINRLVIVMVIAEAVLIGYRFIISRNLSVANEWRRGIKAQLPVITAIGMTALVATLSAEAMNYASFPIAMMPWPVIGAVFVALISLFWACIAFALSPGRDPFNLSERGRMRYVYGAEALTVITMLHARLTLPQLFGGFFRTWWPLVIMGLAFMGVGLGEVFRKRGKLVFAEPLERTGILLPLLPVIGFWIIGSEVSYSGLLFLVGLFYGALSVARRSLVFGTLAVIAGNGGLWNWLSGVDGYSFYQHPQLWLIPVALSVMAAARINRERLTQDQMTMVRYATLMMIYVSSTSDVFINGAAESPWLTMALAVLSVMGVIAGLMMRVRAFLFLGTAFLLLSVLTMIWTASVTLNWGWLWYVTGIAFGVLILLTAVLFERKREEMLELVGRLKQWQA